MTAMSSENGSDIIAKYKCKHNHKDQSYTHISPCSFSIDENFYVSAYVYMFVFMSLGLIQSL